MQSSVNIYKTVRCEQFKFINGLHQVARMPIAVENY